MSGELDLSEAVPVRWNVDTGAGHSVAVGVTNEGDMLIGERTLGGPVTWHSTITSERRMKRFLEVIEDALKTRYHIVVTRMAREWAAEAMPAALAAWRACDVNDPLERMSDALNAVQSVLPSFSAKDALEVWERAGRGEAGLRAALEDIARERVIATGKANT